MIANHCLQAVVYHYQQAINRFISDHQDKRMITLLYAAKDDKHTYAGILQEFLQQQFGH